MADDYIPTTEEVRADYADRVGGRRSPIRRWAEFNRWLAAHDAAKRAEWEAEQGETEWEYRTLLDGGDPCPHGRLTRGEITPEEWFATRFDAGRHITLERRRRVGPWEPVPNTGAEDEFAPGECDGSGTCTAPIHIHGCFTPHRSDQCDSPDEYGHIDTGAES